MAKSIKVLSRRQVFSPDPTRVGKLDYLITYTVNDDPTLSFFITYPVETWSEQTEQEAIVKAEAQRTLTQPRTFHIP